MFNHVMLGANDIAATKTFYEKVLGVLGYQGPAMEHTSDSGHKRVFFIHGGQTFGISEPINGEDATPGNGSTLGFRCDSPEQVKEFHDVAVANGGMSIEDVPGLRNGSMGPMHLAYVRDPSGNKLCAIHRPA